MAAKSKSGIYHMDLAEFNRYLGDKRKEMTACAEKAEAIQERFTKIFTTELAAWQETFAYCFTSVSAQRGEMPAQFAQLIDRIESEERARIRKEIADLDKEVIDGRATMDELLAKSQTATDQLRDANPGLNDREERLKALMVKYQNEYAQAYEEIETLQAAPLGGIRNLSKIQRLKKGQRLARRQQMQALRNLRKVRENWLAKVEEAGDTQAELRAEWQAMGVRVSEAQSRREYLDGHFDDLAVEAGLTRVLEEMKKAPEDIPGELGEKLEEMVARNKVRWAYEDGLQSAAEAIGMANGIDKGMKRFHASVKQVLGEQRRYSLKQVSVPVSHSVAVLNETWQKFTNKASDVGYMAKHPREFSHLVQEYITTPLTDAEIKGLFESMGEALNRATAVWK